MIRFDDIRVWDSGERIDLIAGDPEIDRLLVEGHAARDGEIDASLLTLAPGLADPHVHFRDPGQTDKETMVTGAQAAAAGGYTNVLIMPNTEPSADGVSDTLHYLDSYESAHHVKLPVDYRLSICASVGRRGQAPTNIERIQECAGMDHPVVAITDDGAAITPEILDQVLTVAKSTGLPVLEHCEHHDSGVINDGAVSRELGVPGVPASTELRVVERDIEAVRRLSGQVHVHFQHVSTVAAFDAIRRAKAEGLPITCETAPHYLALCDEDVRRYGSLAKMNPPLRSRADREATLQAVADGTVDMIATDHAPHTVADKERGLLDAPNGIIGLETAYGVCHKVLVSGGIIDELRLIELMAIAPARLMGYEPTDITALLERSDMRSDIHTNHGRRVLDLTGVQGGTSANLTLLDQQVWWTVNPERFHSKACNTPFAGWNLTGLPMATILGGNLAFSRIPQNLSNLGKDR